MKALTIKPQTIILFCSLSLAILFYSLPSQALTVQEVPNPRQVNGGWVTDMANILAPITENQINQIISDLEAKNGTEIAVVTVRETSPSASVKEFATTLFNYWGIGKADRDNGVLFLISQGDRRVEIVTGYGIEEILSDAKVGQIIDSEIIPQFKQGKFDEGTLAGTKAIVLALTEPSKMSISQNQHSPWGLPIVGAIWGLCVMVIWRGRYRGSDYISSRARRGYYDGGSRNGCSSSDYGGGSSGGSGAGGNW